MTQSKLISPFDEKTFIGYVLYVSPQQVRVHFPSSSLLKKYNYGGEELNAGIVGNYVVIEGENYGFLGKILEIFVPEKERYELTEADYQSKDFHPTGRVEVLLCFDYFKREIKKGLDQFPSVGSKVFICSATMIQYFFRNFGQKILDKRKSDTLFDLARLPQDEGSIIKISPQAIFGRHAAVVGTTGGGKSFTVAKLIEETLKHKGKCILIDATGEYKNFDPLTNVSAFVLNQNCHFDYKSLKITDLFPLFRPSEQVQLPKLQDAIRSLKLVKQLQSKSESDLDANDKIILGHINSHGFLQKSKRARNDFLKCYRKYPQINDFNVDFDFSSLPFQVKEECIYTSDPQAENNFGGPNERDLGNCQSLISRILFVLSDHNFKKILNIDNSEPDANNFVGIFTRFLNDDTKNLLRIGLNKTPFDANVREIVVNAIGRYILEESRKEVFRNKPIIVFIDEAHQFLNKKIKGEFSYDLELNAFDNIAKECRKYGVFLCLATQMPRDIPIGTLSQIGTFLTHRLINTHDKEAIESACSSMNRHVLSFLPILGEGEVLLMGVDFPMPVILKIIKPNIEPEYGTPLIFS